MVCLVSTITLGQRVWSQFQEVIYPRDNKFWTAVRYLEFKATRFSPGGNREIQESAGDILSLVIS